MVFWAEVVSAMESAGLRYTGSVESPACLQILCRAILARKASGRVVLTKHSWVSFYRSLHLFTPRKINTPLLLFSDLGVSFLDHILHFLYCCAWNPSSGHFGHIQGQAHVGLFQLYTTCLRCHRSRHAEYLQEISCCFKHWDAAIISTIYASVASSMVIKACSVHSRGCLSRNSSEKIPGWTTLSCSISRTVRTNAFADHEGFLLWAVMNWSCSTCLTPAGYYTLNWWPVTTVWIYAHPTACCIIFVLRPVLWRILKCTSWVIFLVSTLAASWWTNWCLQSCCVSISDQFYSAPANRLDLVLLWPRCGGCISLIWWLGIGEEDDNKMKWEVLTII